MLADDFQRWLAVTSLCIGLVGIGVAVGMRGRERRVAGRATLPPLLCCIALGFLIGLGWKAAQWLVPNPPIAGVRVELDCANTPAQSPSPIHDGERTL